MKITAADADALGITGFMAWAPPDPRMSDREAICRACEHLIGGLRCGNLNCGCPKSANRVEPWKNLPRCVHWQLTTDH